MLSKYRLFALAVVLLTLGVVVACGQDDEIK